MDIQPVSAYTTTALFASSLGQRQNLAALAANSVATQPAADRTTISQAARDRIAEEAGATGAQDFRSVSPDDVLGTVNNLIKSGRMSLDESTALMAFVPRDGIGIGKPSTPSTVVQSIDVISGLENMVSYNKSIDNSNAVAYAQKAIQAISRINYEAIQNERIGDK